MEIKVYSHPLPEDLNQKVEHLLDENFGLLSGASAEEVEAEKLTHYSLPIKYVLAFDGGELAGVVLIFSREISGSGTLVKVGGLGGVCVKEEHRRKGIAQVMIKQAGKELVNMGADIGMLFTNINNPNYINLYSRFGWVFLGRHHVFVDKAGETHKNHPAAMICPVMSQEKINLLLGSKEPIDIGAGEF